MAVFEARVNAFSLDSIVSMAAGLTRRFWKDRGAFDRDLRRAGLQPSAVFLPTLIRRLVTEAIVRRQLPDAVTPGITAEWFARAERVLQDATSASDYALLDALGPESTAMRSLQAQYHDQLNYDTFVRELWLGMDTVRRCAAAGVDLDRGFSETFGISYFELALLSFAAWSTVIEGNGVIDDFPGNYTDWRIAHEKKKRAGYDVEKKEAAAETKKEIPKKITKPVASPTKKKLSFKEKNELENLGNEIPVLEARKVELNDKLVSGNIPYNEMNLMIQELERVNSDLERKELRWLELSELNND